jgi:citrate lyase subunit beta/citryl-CoA lyase
VNATRSIESIRSFLYVPGDRTDRIRKAVNSAADAVLIDLEDAVASSAKSLARDSVCEFLDTDADDDVLPWVRINAGAVGRSDLAALTRVAHRIGGLVLAKCDEVAWLDEVASTIGESVSLSPLIESAVAVRHLDAICAHPRVDQCHLGEIDLIADLGANREGAEQLLGHARSELIYASAAAEILPPIAGVHAAVRDLDGLTATSRALANVGFNGRPAIHPSQVEVINAAFTPSTHEVDAARRTIDQYQLATDADVGAVVDLDGAMLDEAVVRRARRVLARADTIASRAPKIQESDR